jgi:hypothetical protein
MIKVASAPLPNHSLNQSITHYIIIIAAFKKELKAEDNRIQENSGKKAFLLWTPLMCLKIISEGHCF